MGHRRRWDIEGEGTEKEMGRTRRKDREGDGTEKEVGQRRWGKGGDWT